MNWKYYLKKSVWFGGLNNSEQEELIDLGKDIQYKDKERLFLEGNPKTDLFVLGEGTVLISKLTEAGNESVINVLSEGEIFPHAGLFDHTDYPGTATAKKDVRVLALPVDQIEAFILARPEVSIKIIQMMNQNMLMLQRKLNELLSMDVHARLQSAIDHLSRIQGNEIILTHQELGHLIGSTRETVSRQLKKWENAGYMTIKKDRIIIHPAWEERV